MKLKPQCRIHRYILLLLSGILIFFNEIYKCNLFPQAIDDHFEADQNSDSPLHHQSKRQSNYKIFTAFAPTNPAPQNVTYYYVYQPQPAPSSNQANLSTTSYQANPSTTSYESDPATSSYVTPPSNSSYTAPPQAPTYTTPPPVTSYTTVASYEAPPRVIYRKFGYVCETLTSQKYCIVGTSCDQYGRKLKKNRYA